MKRWFKLVTVLCCSITFIIGLQINVNAEEVISSIDMETSIVDDDNDLFLNDSLIQIQDICLYSELISKGESYNGKS